jgi:hypothetical protein
MAWMSQEKKAEIARELKKVMPRDWKYSLSVRHHSTIVLTIQAAPVDLMAIYNKRVAESWERRGDKHKPETYAQVNEYHLDGQFSGELLETFEKIKGALNVGNHDRSDLMTDYYDVGWYVDINIGRWDKPFRVIPATVPEQRQAKIETQTPEPIRRVMVPRSDLANCWRMAQGEC